MTTDLQHLVQALRQEHLDLTEAAAIIGRLDVDERREVYAAVADLIDVHKLRIAVKRSSGRSALDINNVELHKLSQRRIF